ncbi:hypothetical protein PITCH_A1920094 [uncultured Desulfobacterium sp.]|uniref:Uncharacterized protein n=1 Tax=uncultured Desulfobacterium sp. TaxID=201089 RepID=A0A445MWB9_9BACT|nr:hypothetical protein PITCH_A1920094 [uncultured Desulfobacterium sp.]
MYIYFKTAKPDSIDVFRCHYKEEARHVSQLLKTNYFYKIFVLK